MSLGSLKGQLGRLHAPVSPHSGSSPRSPAPTIAGHMAIPKVIDPDASPSGDGPPGHGAPRASFPAS